MSTHPASAGTVTCTVVLTGGGGGGAGGVGPDGLVFAAGFRWCMSDRKTTELIAKAGTPAMAAPPRMAEPDDIAGSVLILAADQAGWITGQTIMANDGNSFGL